MVTQRLLTAEIVLGWTKVGLVLVDDLLRDEFRYSMDFWPWQKLKRHLSILKTLSAELSWQRHFYATGH